ncbi:hypothetical protein N7481_002584 [Penicillium waksmanii]|uniref:uncharacterized protein n=1 Tax=Penicillium waksmanii TaxID=69791 RepID=UPI0025499DE0|nr:uncharacterized protein N7481_002584 [Penicillium waksmanii]KAJ5995607.1 hypothetical protein N7481_002584 [Penicillium waksmanii]
MFTHLLFAILVALPVVRAGGWDDFSNNLATDLAPFLSLFGEQITKQYLSESITKTDYFIFAMAPMGILTGVVSAIRVCGTPSLRAFIGRAQEGAGNAEAELCTSTSRDVCELYNSGGIARVFGRPKILEVVHDPDHVFSNSSDDTAGIYTFQQYLEKHKGKALWRKRIKQKGKALWRKETPEKTHEDTESGCKSDTFESNVPLTTFAPNLSLNIGIKKQPTYVFYTIAIVGLILQVGVLVFAGIATYYLKWGNDDSPPRILCMSTVGRSTQEDIWDRQENETDKLCMYWVQPGGQIIGDQTFDAFSHTDCDNKLKRYITSRKNGSQEPNFEVWIAIGTTISGFVLQFTGLRGIHSAVSIAQLGVIMIMSTARAALRMQRLKPDDNCFAKFPDEVVGHELDWLALRIGRDVIDKDIKRDADSPTPRSSSSGQPDKKLSDSSPLDSQCRPFWRLCGAPDIKRMNLEHPFPNKRQNAAAILLAYRTRLASLTDSSTSSARDFKNEMVEVRSKSRQLADLIEATLKIIFSMAEIKAGWKVKIQREPKEAQSMFWGIDCTIGKQVNDNPERQTIYLELAQDPGAPGSPWLLKNRLELEGILGLWVWSLKSDPAIEIEDLETGLTKSTADNIQSRRIVPTDRAIKMDLDIWLGDDINIITHEEYALPAEVVDHRDASTLWTKTGQKDATARKNSSSAIQSLPPRVRFFGRRAAELSQSQDSNSSKKFSAAIKGSLVSACAQEVFVSFFTSILDIVDDFGPVKVQEDKGFRLENSLVTEIVRLFTEMRLGSRQEAALCVMPLLIPRLKTPSAISALEAVRKSTKERRRFNEWNKAETTLRWVWNICTQTQHGCADVINEPKDQKLAEQATIALCELYRWALMDESTRAFGKKGISWLQNEKSRRLVHQVIDHYVHVADRIAQPEASSADLLAAIEKENLTSALLLVTYPASKMENEQKGKALLLAAMHGWAQVVFALLQLISSPDFRDSRGRTPLSYAAQKGHIDALTETPLSYASEAGFQEVTRLLLRDSRVSPDNRDNDGRTPLWWAAQIGHKDIVTQLLLNKKVDPDAMDNNGLTPLWWAVQNGHKDIVTQLLQNKKVNPDTMDNNGRTPLWGAVQKGHKDIVTQLLLNKKVDPDAMDNYGLTPLWWAVQNGHKDIVTQLLQNEKVNPDAKDNNGQTLLLWAVQEGHKDIVTQLLLNKKVDPNVKDNDGRTPLWAAVQEGHKDIVIQLLQNKKVDPDAMNNDRLTPLWGAVQNEHTDIVIQLLQNEKVDPDARAYNGRTPLWWAVQKGHKDIVTQLLQNEKVDPDAKSHIGLTLLWWAVQEGHKDIVTQLLLNKKVDPNVKDNDGRTPLWGAVQEGHKDIVTQLLQNEKLLQNKKVDPDAKDTFGQTPLWGAVQKGYKDIVIQLLLNKKVDPDAKDNYGRTPLWGAVQEGHKDIVTQLLQNEKVDPDAKDKFGQTPLWGGSTGGT